MSRPPIPPEDRRIKIWPWVSPETKAAIEEYSKSEKVSNGQVIDKAVKLLKEKK